MLMNSEENVAAEKRSNEIVTKKEAVPEQGQPSFTMEQY